jgi:hypothetical protein
VAVCTIARCVLARTRENEGAENDHDGFVEGQYRSRRGSSGVSALLQAYGRCQIEGIPLRIVATNTAVLRTLELCGVVGVLDIRDSLADATRTQAA